MATYYKRDSGTNWHSDASWSTVSSTDATNAGTHPGAGDTANFDASSASCTVDSAAACAILNCTGYTNTLTLAAGLTTSGNVTLVSGMTLDCGTQTWTFSGGTIIPAGKTVHDVNINNATVTLSTSNLTISGDLTLTGGSAILAGQTVTMTGGTWSQTSTGHTTSNLIFDGDITVSGIVDYETGTLTCNAGHTITTTSSSLHIGASCTLDTPTANMSWNEIYGVGTATLTLTSNITLTGKLCAYQGTTLTLATSDVTCVGIETNTTGIITGTTRKITLSGGTWQSTSWTSGYVATNIDLAGDVTISGSIGYRTSTLAYVSGTITTTSSTLNIGASCTINTPTASMSWNNITTTAASTLTLSSAITLTGLLKSNSGTMTIATSNITCVGLTVTGAISASGRTITLTGGTWSGAALVTGTVELAGNITLQNGGSIYITGTVLYTSGTITTTSNDIRPTGTCTFNTPSASMSWNIITPEGSSPALTLSSGTTCALYRPNCSGTASIATSTLTCTAGIQMVGGNCSGQPIIITGGTWSSGANMYVNNNLTFSGDVTVSGTVYYHTGTLTCDASHTITTTSSTLTINSATTLNTSKNDMIWNIISVPTTHTLTLSSDISAETLTISSGATLTLATSDLYVRTLTPNGTATLVGRTVYLTGTGTIGHATHSGYISSNININSTATSISNFYYKTGTITYVAGTITGTGGILPSGACTLDTSGMYWPAFQTGGGGVSFQITLTSDLYITGQLVLNNGGTITLATSDVYCAGLNMAAAIVTGRTIHLTGGTWQSAEGGYVGRVDSNLSIEGNVTVSGNVPYGSQTLTYVSGTVTTTSSTLKINSSCNINTGLLAWNNVTIAASTTATLTGNLRVDGTLTITVTSGVLACGTNTVTLAGNLTNNRGTSGITGNCTFIFNGTTTISESSNIYNVTINAGKTVNITSTKVITIAGTFNGLGNSSSHIILKAVTAESAAHWDVTTVGTVDFVDATDIDSATGSAIETYGGTTLRTVNWTELSATAELIETDTVNISETYAIVQRPQRAEYSETITLSETDAIFAGVSQYETDSASLQEDFELSIDLYKQETLSLSEDFEAYRQALYSIKQDFRWNLAGLKDIGNTLYMVWQFVRDMENRINFIKSIISNISNGLRTHKEVCNSISNRFRMILSWQKGAIIPFISLGKEYIKVYIGGAEQTDVDIDSINIGKRYNAASEARFTLLRAYDGTKPSVDSTISITYNNYTLYNGYITSITPTDNPDTMAIGCQDEFYKTTQEAVAVKVGRESLYEGRTIYSHTIAESLTALGINFGIGSFLPEYELKETTKSEAITSLVSLCGNYAWYYEGSNPTLVTLGNGNIIDLETQELGTNLNLYQVLNYNITEDTTNICNCLLVNTGGIVRANLNSLLNNSNLKTYSNDVWKPITVTKSGNLIPTPGVPDPQTSSVSGTLTHKWEVENEAGANIDKKSAKIDGYNIKQDADAWKYAPVWTRYYFGKMNTKTEEVISLHKPYSIFDVDIIEDPNEWTNYKLTTETRLNTSDKNPSYIHITLPGSKADGWTFIIGNGLSSLRAMGCVKKPELYGGIDINSDYNKSRDPAELEDAIFVAERENLVDEDAVEGYLMKGFSLEAETGLVRMSTPIYATKFPDKDSDGNIIYTDPTVNKRLDLNLTCSVETTYTREELEEDQITTKEGNIFYNARDWATSYPEYSETALADNQAISDSTAYEYKFRTSRYGTYTSTVYKYLQLGAYSIHYGGWKTDNSGVRIYIPSWNDLPYAYDLANWELTKNGNIKYKGSVTITLDAFYYYNIKLNSRIRMSAISSQIFNITDISYNISDFTVTLTIETFDPYNRTVSLPYHGE